VVREAVRVGDERAFCRPFGSETLREHLGEFLDSFMVRRVMAGHAAAQASGQVTGKLLRWLAPRGYTDTDSANEATSRARTPHAGCGSPIASASRSAKSPLTRPNIEVDALDDQGWVEDHLAIGDM
jgi:hypothetical protein